MAPMTFKLSATVRSDDLDGVRAPLETFLGAHANLERTEDGFKIEAAIDGDDARELNRQLLSELRKIENKTRLRAPSGPGAA